MSIVFLASYYELLEWTQVQIMELSTFSTFYYFYIMAGIVEYICMFVNVSSSLPLYSEQQHIDISRNSSHSLAIFSHGHGEGKGESESSWLGTRVRGL